MIDSRVLHQRAITQR